MKAIEQDIVENMAEEDQIVEMDFDDVDVLVDFGDGFYWVDLKVTSCELEGNAMGHCGNTAENQDYHTVISLRKQISKGHFKPFLTFILDTKTGYLGETKGRANSKPAERYHKYIVELLKLPMIKGFEAGGYAPEENFHFDDLSQEMKDQVLNHKDDKDFGDRKAIPRFDRIFNIEDNSGYRLYFNTETLVEFNVDEMIEDPSNIEFVIDFDSAIEEVISDIMDDSDDDLMAKYIAYHTDGDVDEIKEALDEDRDIVSDEGMFDDAFGIGSYEKFVDDLVYRSIPYSDFREKFWDAVKTEVGKIMGCEVDVYIASNPYESNEFSISVHENKSQILDKLLDERYIEEQSEGDFYIDVNYFTNQVTMNMKVDDLTIDYGILDDIRDLVEYGIRR